MNIQLEYNWAGKTLLIAEDEDFNFMFLEELLSNTNVTIIRALTGEEVLQHMEQNPNIDLILMDVQMPVMDGYTATQKIREQGNNIPIIAQTAYTFTEAIAKIKASGHNEYISKPIDMDVLLSTIDKYIKG